MCVACSRELCGLSVKSYYIILGRASFNRLSQGSSDLFLFYLFQLKVSLKKVSHGKEKSERAGHR